MVPPCEAEEATINVPVPQIAVPVPFHKETDEVIRPVTAERSSECTVEQLVDMPVPQIQEQNLEVAEITPRRRIPERTVGQIDDVPVPQIHEQIVGVVKNILQERISERIARTDCRCDNASNSEEIVEGGFGPT